MRITLLVAALAAALATSSASAKVVAINVTGTVTFGLDNLGLFGGAGQSLRGASYVMNFAYDITNAANLGNSQQVNGGTSFSRPSPIVRADLSINGTTLSAIDPYSATYGTFRLPAGSQLDFRTGGPNGINGAGLSWSRADQGIAPALDASVNRTFDASDTVFSSFQRANQQLTVFTYLSLKPETITIGAASAAVPEPASWALMIAGFAGAGFAIRRRRRVALRGVPHAA